MQQNEVQHTAAAIASSGRKLTDLNTIATQLTNEYQRIPALDHLLTMLAHSNENPDIINPLIWPENRLSCERVFLGLKQCLLQSPQELQSEQSEYVLMKTNQLLYDMMPDILKSTDLQSEMQKLIPALIQNLGNSKGTVRKQTHKVIGTFVKLSKKLEPVLTVLIHHGIGSKENRTRQHSMLVIPALISLKPSVVEQRPPAREMQLLMDEVMCRLRDQAEVVAKTARKLIAELHKCYPDSFKLNFIDTLASADERQICQLIITNQMDEAVRLIQQTATTTTTSFGAPVSSAASMSSNRQGQSPSTLSQPQKQTQQVQQVQMAAYGKSLQPQSQQSSSSLQAPAQIPNSQLPGQKAGSLMAQGPLKPHQSQIQQKEQLRELSVVGHEIVSSQQVGSIQKAASHKASTAEPIQEPPSSAVQLKSQQSLPSQRKPEPLVLQAQAISPPLIQTKLEAEIVEVKPAFGIVDPQVVQALNENNPWQERTQAIEQLESAINQQASQMTADQACDLLQFLITLIQDINFKISLASLKIITTLYRRQTIQSQKHLPTLINSLVEKLSDSKSVVRDAVLECCALLIDQFTPAQFLLQIHKSFQNTNWHVREGLQILLARCLIETAEAEQDTAQLMSLKVLQELVSALKLEDKAKLQQMGCDNFAFAIYLAKDQQQFTLQVKKALGLQKKDLTARESELLDQIEFRNEIQAFPAIAMPSGRIQFQQWMTRAEDRLHNQQAQQQHFEEAQHTLYSTSQTPSSPNKPNVHLQSAADTHSKYSLQQDYLLAHETHALTSPKEGRFQFSMSNVQNEAPIPDNQMSRSSYSNQLLQSQNQMIHTPEAFSQLIRPPMLPPQTLQQETPIWLPQRPNDDMARQNSRKSDQPALTPSDFNQQIYPPQFLPQKTFDQQSVLTSTTLVSSTNKPEPHSRFPVQKQQSEGNRSLMFSDNKKSIEMPDNFRQAFGHSQQLAPQQNQTQYIPEQHKSQPRSIQSNQDKQRLLPDGQTQEQTNTNRGRMQDQPGLTHQQLYKPSSSVQDDMSSDQGASSVYGQRRSGPVRAQHTQEQPKYLKKTISESGTSAEGVQSSYPNRQAVSAVKPPTYGRPPAVSDSYSEQPNRGVGFNKSHERNSSIEFSHQKQGNDLFQQSMNSSKKSGYTAPSQQSVHSSQQLGGDDYSEHGMLNAAENVGADYTLKEEPLPNPGHAFQQAISDLKSKNWQVQFEACNTIRRAGMFHTGVCNQNSAVFKELVKPVDSLRSQVSKNACLALQALFGAVETRIADQQMDNVLPILLKRAADTNYFISESAETTIQVIVAKCSETRVFASLQSQPLKQNKQKELVCHCYTLLLERLASNQRLKQFPSIERLIQTVVIMLNEAAPEVRNQAKVFLLKLQQVIGSQRDFDSLLQRAHLNDRQMEQIYKVIKQEDLEQLSHLTQTRYGQLRTNPQSNNMMGQTKSVIGVTDGFRRRSAGKQGSTMVQTFLSGNEAPLSVGSFHSPIPHNESIYSANVQQEQQQQKTFGSTDQSTAFKKRTTSVSKPVDRDTIEQFKTLCDSCREQDWQKRLRSIDELQNWCERNSKKVKSAQPGSFITLVDTYSQLIQDNNQKVQSRAQSSFETVLSQPDFGQLLNSNLTMIVQALSQNLSSTNQNTRQHGDHLFTLLEDVVMGENHGTTNALIMPLTNQINLNTCRAKAQLVQRLAGLVGRVDKMALLERYVLPLLTTSNKIQQEANGNQQLRHALLNLEGQMQH